MKKIFVLSICIFTFSIVLHAQEKENDTHSTTVPAKISQSFAKDFPGMTATWDKEEANYEGNFKMDGKTMSVLYDAAGNRLETEEDMPISNLLQSVRDYIAKHYKGKKIKEAAIITRANGEVNIEAEVNGMDLLFTKQGQFIKAVRVED